ncbi:MAG: 4-hydroxy-tetrahydrodipicolinate reductase [Candidatus Melainabacteria bacterium HGW-Melainabacteria-1]|nr:MAG: 4-hydroxy-tetrahydrodipicolinate reductase [Candidatus Melainabacteria bacterium HGW-Melainabacteria-1]
MKTSPKLEEHGDLAEQVVSVIVTGAAGKMGREAVKAISTEPKLQLSGALTHSTGLGRDAGTVAGIEPLGVSLTDDLTTLLAQVQQPAVLVDLTRGEPAFAHAQMALDAGLSVVIGATGLSGAQVESLASQASAQGLGVLIAPNFSIGALLMMNFAAMAARYFNWVEIIELHHDKKADAPSGTALKTASLIAAANSQLQAATPDHAARGQLIEGIPVHSIRLPGLLAHQEVIFGDPGQTLTLRHDTLDRSCFMTGLLLSIDKVQTFEGLVYGLEKLI